MPYDFDPRMTSQKILNNLKKRIRNGSVIVLHDKPSSSVTSFLDEFIKYAKEKGYMFVIPPFSET
jgi:peptidoglycan/xylan/chitin deacetylase (PgdA/CDA1 family)